MLKRPLGVWAIALVDALFGCLFLFTAGLLFAFEFENLIMYQGATVRLWLTSLGVDLLMAVFALLCLKAAYSTLFFKPSARLENTVVCACILLLALSLLWLDFAIPIHRYSGGVRIPYYNVAFHLATAFYAVGAVYYLSRQNIKSLFAAANPSPLYQS